MVGRVLLKVRGGGDLARRDSTEFTCKMPPDLRKGHYIKGTLLFLSSAGIERRGEGGRGKGTMIGR